jgi:hypothetical protein
MRYSHKTFNETSTTTQNRFGVSVLGGNFTKRPTQEDIKRAQERAIKRNSGKLFV